MIPQCSHIWEPEPWNPAWSLAHSIYSLETCCSHCVHITLINFHGASTYLLRGDSDSPLAKSKLSVLYLKSRNYLINKYSGFLNQIRSTTGISKTKELLKLYRETDCSYLCPSVWLITAYTYWSTLQAESLSEALLLHLLWSNLRLSPQRTVNCSLKAASSSK